MKIWINWIRSIAQILPQTTYGSWIAATAMTYGLPVATGNIREFKKVTGLPVVPV